MVTGLGGLFFKSAHKQQLIDWYRDGLGLSVSDWGGVCFASAAAEELFLDGYSLWSVFESSNDYFKPSERDWMVNFRVNDLDAVLQRLRAHGGWVDEKVDESEYGRFGWAMDPDGNKIELWQPPPRHPVIYEVQLQCQPEQAAAVCDYMRERHLPQILATGCFARIDFEQLADDCFRSRYEADSAADLARYLAEHTASMREDFLAHFPEGVSVSRSEWQPVQRLVRAR